MNADTENFLSSFKCHTIKQDGDHTERCEKDYNLLYQYMLDGDIQNVKIHLAQIASEKHLLTNYQPVQIKMCHPTILHAAVDADPPNLHVVEALLKHIDSKELLRSVLELVMNSKRRGECQLLLIKMLVLAGAEVNRSLIGQYLDSVKKSFDPVYWEPTFDFLLSKCQDQLDCYNKSGLPVLHEFLNVGIPMTGRKPIAEMWPITESEILVVITKLLQSGAHVNMLTSQDETLLHIALRTENYAVCKLLVEAGVNGNVNSVAGGNALSELSLFDPPFSKRRLKVISDIIKLFVCQGKVDINMKGTDGSTTLHTMADSDLSDVRIIEILVNHGADTMAVDIYGNTLLHAAVRNPDDDILKYFLGTDKIDINRRNVHRIAPFHYACLSNDHPKIKVLLDAGADVNLRACLGATGLHLSARFFQTDECGEDKCFMLQEAGVDINALDDYQCSALHYSVFCSNTEYSSVLKNAGIDDALVDSKGLTASDYVGRFQKKNLLNEAPSVITLNEVSDYTDTVHSTFNKCGWLVSGGISFLSELGIQAVDQEAEENSLVRTSIEEFFLDVVTIIGQMDWVFQGRLVTSGSSYEGAKIERPDEFDYMVDLVHFSKIASALQNDQHSGFTIVEASDVSTIPEKVRQYVTIDGLINSKEILKAFKRLFQLATIKAHSKPHKHIQPFPATVDATMPMVDQNSLVDHDVLWISHTYKILHISVDVNPVLFMDKWPMNSRCSSSLHPSISSLGIYLIPKLPVESVDEISQTLWRLSFSHVELLLFKTLNQSAVDGYILAKAMRMAPVCPRITSDPEHRTGSEVSSDTEYGSDDEPMLVRDMENSSPLIQTFTGENLIKTYYLKQLFYQVMDDLTASKCEYNAVIIAQEVYRKLRQAVQDESLSSYFTPSQNLYSEPWQCAGPNAEDYRKPAQRALCEHILRILSGTSGDTYE